MSHKKSLMIAIVIAIIICVGITFAVIILLNQQVPNTTQNPVSIPVSAPTDNNVNVIKINPNSNTDYKFATITSDDTIELRNGLGNKFIIGLDHRKWKSIKWSDNNNLVAVLGETVSGIYDIYIYDFSQKSWSRVTNFQSSDTGVDSFVWQSSDTILFTQGNVPDRWLHRYNYSSKNEILKLSKIQGTIISLSPDKKNLVMEEDDIFFIYGIDGQIIESEAGLKDDSGNTLNITSVIINSVSSKIFIGDKNGVVYKKEFGDKVAVKLDLTGSYLGLCNVNADIFLTYNYTDETKTLKLANINVKESTVNYIAQGQFDNTDTFNKIICLDPTSALVQITDKDGILRWYKNKDASLQEQVIFKGLTEVNLAGQ